MTERPIALRAAEVPPRPRPSGYPADLAAKIAGREKRVLGDPFGLVNFGVNLTRLAPGAGSSIHHLHAKSDEWIYVLEGTPPLYVGDEGALVAGPASEYVVSNQRSNNSSSSRGLSSAWRSSGLGVILSNKPSATSGFLRAVW